MENPRTPGTGISGAWISLGGDRSKSYVAVAGTHFNDDRKRHAAILDREADALLQHGHHQEAERLAWRAEALRGGTA